MDGDGMMMRIGGAHIAREFGQAMLLCFRILLLGFGKVVGHGAFSGQAPDHRIRAPASDQIAPMLLDLGHAHARNEVSPEADNAGGKPMVRQVLNADVRHIEVRRVDAGEIGLPWISRFVGAAWIEGLHVGIESGHDLDHGESLLHAIGGQRLKAIRPA